MMDVLITIIVPPTSFSVATDKSVIFHLFLTRVYKLNSFITDAISEYTVSLALLKSHAIFGTLVQSFIRMSLSFVS